MRFRRVRRRRGFTLVELLVALLVFDAALLAFAADAAVLVRVRGRAAQREAGIAAAESRLAWLRAEGCPPVGAWQGAVAPGVREFWWVAPGAGASRRLRDSVAFGSPVSPGAYVLHSALVC